MDEIGLIDVPAKIDYILNKTKESSLFYVGHSQGTTVIMMTLSSLPEYNLKIKIAVLLAPCAYMKNFPNPFFKIKIFNPTVKVCLMLNNISFKIIQIDTILDGWWFNQYI